jgi:hypothetical protein
VLELDSAGEAAAAVEESDVDTFWALAEPSEKATAAQNRAVCLATDKQRTEVIFLYLTKVKNVV